MHVLALHSFISLLFLDSLDDVLSPVLLNGTTDEPDLPLTHIPFQAQGDSAIHRIPHGWHRQRMIPATMAATRQIETITWMALFGAACVLKPRIMRFLLRYMQRRNDCFSCPRRHRTKDTDRDTEQPLLWQCVQHRQQQGSGCRHSSVCAVESPSHRLCFWIA